MNANGCMCVCVCVCLDLSFPLMSSQLIDEKNPLQFYYFILLADSVNLGFVDI